METFSERMDVVRKRLVSACERVGRDPESVRIVAVAKTHGPDAVREAAECGVLLIGESRIQEARQKISMCPGHLEWHLVGHLQRNKARDAVRLFRYVHSVDSWRLLEALEAACRETGAVMPVCLEVNVSGESSKFGLSRDDVPGVLKRCAELVHVEIDGLMTVPPFTEDPEGARLCFRRLREWRDEWAAATGIPLSELSMGMSNDFEVAVEEGATMVRLGTVLFGKRPKKVPGDLMGGDAELESA